MNVVDIFTEAGRAVGYRVEAIVPDYTFADVLDPAGVSRTVAVAAFSQTPANYRSAAFAAVLAEAGDPQAFADRHRALGAPALFVIEGDHTSLWEIRGSKPSRRRERLPIEAVPRLFEKDRDRWRPETIHRAKSIGAVDSDYRLDSVDVGLLPTVEGEMHAILARLLRDAFGATYRNAHDDETISPRDLFRLLAAKSLFDRRHDDADEWPAEDPGAVLLGIDSYYDLGRAPAELNPVPSEGIAAAWECLRHGINFSCIPSEDVAYVYGEILTGPESGWRLGVRRTPRQLAEYAVARLQLHRLDADALRVYQPFAGAAPFLVSAVRHLRDQLPVEWRDEERHEFLIDRVCGDETRVDAREAAVLSLVLADYPNRNGWRIEGGIPFGGEFMARRMNAANVILCNPLFENFDQKDSLRRPLSGIGTPTPAAALDAALTASPAALAFMLPHAFVRGRKFQPQRKKIQKTYEDIEIVDLPQAIMDHPESEGVLLIARTPRPHDRSFVSLRSTEIAPRDYDAFLKQGRVTAERFVERTPETGTGALWIPELGPVWDSLASLPKLGDAFKMHRGLQWRTGTDRARRRASVWSREARPGYKRGLHTVRGIAQFALAESPVYLDVRVENLRGNAIRCPWPKPKLIVNAGGLSEGPWRIAAAADRRGLMLSQQFIGLWPCCPLSDLELTAFAAILNSPVANAFVAIQNPAKVIRISQLRHFPIPTGDLSRIGESVAEYMRLVAEGKEFDRNDRKMAALLTEIDAQVLDAYDLPARIEKQLLGYFRDAKRPVAHAWRHWDETHPMAGLTLTERLSGRFRPHGSWILDVFRPLPDEEADILRKYGVR